MVRTHHRLDAQEQPVGRLASAAAQILTGKHKAAFQPWIDHGDFVTIVNAKLARFTGRKLTQKRYRRASGYPGGLKERSVRELVERQPTAAIRHAVYYMLPKNRLRAGRMRRLTITP